MNNLYLFVGENKGAIDLEINKICNKLDMSLYSVNKYSLSDTSLADILEDLDTYSFITTNKIIIIEEAYFLETTTMEFEDNHLNHLLKYLKNPNLDNIFIMIATKLDERKKIVKEVKKIITPTSVVIDNNFIINNYLQEYSINNEAYKLLCDYCNDDIYKLKNECMKLAMLKVEDKTITKEDIIDNVKNSRVDISQLTYDFVKYIAKKDKKNIFKYYELLEKEQLEINSIIGLIASQMRLIYQILIGKENNMSKEDIAKKINQHPYRVSKSYEFLEYYNIEDVKEFINKLSLLDYNIKSGRVDIKTGFFLFLIEV